METSSRVRVSETRDRYNKRYNEICESVQKLYGEFKRDFISISNATLSEVSEKICNTMSNTIDVDDIPRYVYITSFNNDVIIKR